MYNKAWTAWGLLNQGSQAISTLSLFQHHMQIKDEEQWHKSIPESGHKILIVMMVEMHMDIYCMSAT